MYWISSSMGMGPEKKHENEAIHVENNKQERGQVCVLCGCVCVSLKCLACGEDFFRRNGQYSLQ